MKNSQIIGSGLQEEIVVRTGQPLTLPPGTVSWLEQLREDQGSSKRALVGTLYRAIDIRGKYMSRLPFEIVNKKTGDVVDDSTNWKNAVGFLPKPKRMLMLAAASSCVYGANYFFKVGEENAAKPLLLRHLPSGEIELKTDVNGLSGFTRTVNGRRAPLERDRVLWHFSPDEDVELGPALKTPVRAAGAAAGVLLSIDEFARGYFQRGAIKATLLSVAGSSDPDERSALEDWWTTFMQGGLSRAFRAKVVNADRIVATVIGEGLEAIDKGELSASEQREIAIAMGIPFSMLFSDAANHAVSEQDVLNLYEGVLIPESELYQEDWNEQLYYKLGLMLRFTPQKLSVFQADENERSTSFLNYVQGGMKPSIAVQVLGITLPADVTPDMLDDVSAPADEEPPTIGAAGSGQAETSAAARSELKALHKKALRAQRVGERLSFEAKHLPPALVAALEGAHASARSAEQVNGTFDDVFAAYP